MRTKIWPMSILSQFVGIRSIHSENGRANHLVWIWFGTVQKRAILHDSFGAGNPVMVVPHLHILRSKPRRDGSVRLNRRKQRSLETALAMHEHGGVLGQAAEDVRLDLVFLQFGIIGALAPS